MVDFVGRRPTLLLVAVLCVGQFVWTCWVERSTLGWMGLALAVVAVAVLSGVFEAVRRRGARRAEGAEAASERAA